MLTLWGSASNNGFCDGMGRRDFIRLGALGGSLTLADMLRMKALGADNGKSGPASKTKSGKVRHVPISSGAMRVLEHLRFRTAEELLDEEAIFANPRTGEPFVSIFYSWNNARIRAGMPEFRIHDLRHSFASYLVNAGRSLYEVQELLGHADITTTSRYAHLSRELLVAAVEVVPQIEIGPRIRLLPQSN